jgi:hypothetical protein
MSAPEIAMTHEEKTDFCTGESPEHCGCMRLNTCTSLAAQLIQSYGRTMPACIRKYYDAYNNNPSLENNAALCKAVWEHINPELRAFMQAYQQYILKNDVHELLDKLIETNENPSIDDACKCDDPQKGGVDVHTIVIGRMERNSSR